MLIFMQGPAERVVVGVKGGRELLRAGVQGNVFQAVGSCFSFLRLMMEVGRLVFSRCERFWTIYIEDRGYPIVSGV